MARPQKQGFSYFSHDTDTLQDDKIKALRIRFRNDGYVFYFAILERTYKQGKPLCLRDPMMIEILRKEIGISLKKFTEILKFSTEILLFSEKFFQESGILWSEAIQRRLDIMSKERIKHRTPDEVMPGETSEKPQNMLAQSKVKESTVNNKEKEIKENKDISLSKLVAPSPFSEDIKLISLSLKEKRGYPSPRYAAEAKAIKDMLRAGYSRDQIMMCWLDIKKDKFWTNKELLMMKVQSEIGAWAKKIENDGNKRGRFRGVVCRTEEDYQRLIEVKDDRNRETPATDIDHETSGTGTRAP